MSLRVTAPIALALGAGVKAFVGFEASMRNVNVIARQSEKDFAGTTQAVLDMARELGAGPTELADALYNINSASFQGAQGLEVLRAATMAGRAGMADTATAARALTNILNAYGKDSSEAGDVSDILFKTVEKGVLTFDDLANSLGTVSATAAAVGVPIEEVAAAMATMTRGGINARESATALNRLMFALAKGTDELAVALQGTGFESGEALLNAKGLGGAIEFLADATKGSVGETSELVSSIRAAKAALSLARESGADFAGDLDIIADKSSRAGATLDAFNEQSKTLKFALDKLKSAFSVIGIQLGETLEPMVRKLADGLTWITEKFDKLSPGIRKIVVIFALIAGAIGPLLVVFGMLASAVSVTVAIIAKIAAVVASVAAAALLPLLAIIAAVALIGTTFLAMWGEGEMAMDRIKDGWGKLVAWIKEKIDQLRTWWTEHGDEVIMTFQIMWIRAKAVFGAIVNFTFASLENMVTKFIWMKDNWRHVGFFLVESFKLRFMQMIVIIDGFASNMKTFFVWLKDNWSAIWSNVWNITKGTFQNMGATITTFFDNMTTNIGNFFGDLWFNITHPNAPKADSEYVKMLDGLEKKLANVEGVTVPDPKFNRDPLGEAADLYERGMKKVMDKMPEGPVLRDPMAEAREALKRGEDEVGELMRKRKAAVDEAVADEKKLGDAAKEEADKVVDGKKKKQAAMGATFGFQDRVKKVQETIFKSAQAINRVDKGNAAVAARAASGVAGNRGAVGGRTAGASTPGSSAMSAKMMQALVTKLTDNGRIQTAQLTELRSIKTGIGSMNTSISDITTTSTPVFG